jgi:UDP-glucose 4-epimerase
VELIIVSTLVTGGAGFIGSNLVEELLAAGEDVIVLDNMQTGSLSNLEGLNGSLKLITASCNDLAGMDLQLEKIYHLGIPSSSPMYKKNPYLVGEALNGFTAVLEQAKKLGARVVYASSSSLYNGLLPPHQEDMTIQVADYYTEARLAMERLAELYQRLFAVRSVGMRFFSVYGPKEAAKKQYANMITQFLWDMKDGKTPIIFGDGSQTRDFIFVKDVVQALQLAMKSDYHGILNVGTGKAHSFNEVIKILNQKLGHNNVPRYVKNPIKNYVLHTLADTSKAKREIGFRSQIDLEAGIDALINNFII